MRTRSSVLLEVVIATVVMLGLASCGSDDDTGGGPPAVTSPGSATNGSSAAQSTTSQAPTVTPTKVAVGLADYSFDIPTSLTAGPTEFVATNTGKEEHHMTLVKLRDGQTMQDVIAVLSGDVAKGLEESELIPGPQGVAPGESQSMIVDLQAGHYVALCAIPGPNGLPHAAMGMIQEIAVEPASTQASGSAVPAEPKVILKDYAFELPSDFDGQGTFRVENVGTKPHEIVFYRVADGKTYDQAAAYLTTQPPPAGPPPVTSAGGVTAMSPGQIGGMVLDLDPGTYVAVCFLPSTDGKTHFEHGMVQKVEIS